MFHWLLFLGCFRQAPIQVTLPNPATACSLPASTATLSIDPPGGRVFQLVVLDDPAMAVWVRTGAGTGRVFAEAPLRFVGDTTLVNAVTLTAPISNAAVSLPAGSLMSRLSYSIGSVSVTRRLGSAVAPLLVTVHNLPCSGLRYAPGETPIPVREVPPEDPGRFYILRDDVLLSAEPRGPAFATLSPARSESYVRVVTLEDTIAKISMTFADDARLTGWISRDSLSPMSIQPPEDDAPGFRGLRAEALLPAVPDGLVVTLPIGLPISASADAEPWAEVTTPARAVIQQTGVRGWVIIQQIAGLEGLQADSPEASVAWAPERQIDLPKE